MSCHVIDARSLISAAQTIYASKYTLNAYHSHALEALHEKLCYWANEQYLDDALTKLTRLAFIINHKAYRERYAHHKDARFCAPHKLPTVTGLHKAAEGVEARLFQALKTLRFLEYQCIDVNAKNRTKYAAFFERLTEAQKLISRALIENAPLYKSAIWG